ncbi:MAG: GNAT family N-acetyltransferase [Candidatus Nomurabacteria bacterium]|jgi:ribosomal-protein-alanine N-acetyltransferase|nr:GNAT family N-acetyltransferase [Candidatus Nomurabacteria bacterium]
MTGLMIRVYRPSDFAQIVRNLKVSENNMYDENVDSEADFSDLVKRHPENILVAEIDGEIVGSELIVPLEPDQATLCRLAVKKDFRNRGVATELLKKAVDSAKQRGFKELGMYVDAGNAELLNFYDRRGFCWNGGHTYKYLQNDLSKLKEVK